MKKIVVKVGTNVLTTEDGLLNLNRIKSIVDQLHRAKFAGYSVILVSSGAVGAGKTVINTLNTQNKVVQRQVYSAVGQIRLMEIYSRFFDEKGIYCAQVLATKEDFRDRSHYLNMKSCFEALLQDNIIPIVNENDVTSVTELMFTDNDELAGLIASMMNAELLVLLTNVDGVYDGNPENPESSLILELNPDSEEAEKFVTPTKSSFGRGGMLTKIRIAQRLSKIGISTIIGNGKKDHILSQILNDSYVGTHIGARKKVSNMKKWMAFSKNEASGKVIINQGAAEALLSKDSVNSLLFVGVVSVEGVFKKNDIIRIFDENNHYIGLGKSTYSHEKASKLIGKKGIKPLIHYDYLFVEN